MIRIVNPVLHTKYLYTPPIRSINLWWTKQPCLDSSVFLQFETFKKDTNGIQLDYSQIWKYPCFHYANHDFSIIRRYIPHVKLCVISYSLEPTPAFQLINNDPCIMNAFTGLYSSLPKKPL